MRDQLDQIKNLTEVHTLQGKMCSVCHDCVTRTPHHSSHETCVLPVYLTFFITSRNQAAHAFVLQKLPDRKSLSCCVESIQKLRSTSLLCF